jgi:hypothetical protein
MMENGRGEERKINGEPAMPILVSDGGGAEAKSSGNGLLFNLYFILGISHFTIAADIYVIVQFVSIPTSYTH